MATYWVVTTRGDLSNSEALLRYSFPLAVKPPPIRFPSMTLAATWSTKVLYLLHTTLDRNIRNVLSPYEILNDHYIYDQSCTSEAF